jgi:tight adherence protein C
MLYVMFFLTVTLFGYALFLFPAERKQQVKRRLSLVTDVGSLPAVAEEDDKKQKLKTTGIIRKWARLGWNFWRRKLGRRMAGTGGEDQERGLELKLLAAGRPFNMGPVEYRMVQISLFLGLPVLFGGYTFMLGAGPGGLVGAAAVGIVGATVLPSVYLRLKTNQRTKLALRELPDVLDLLTVSMEAGLGFDAALGKLVARSEGVLSMEFRRCLEEMRLGKTRREALMGVRERLILDDIKLLISSILQAEKLGIGLVQVFRIQSQEVRDRRKMRAEEAAMKAPIKMLFPLVIFIFPSLFIVLLGPAVIQLIEQFSK